MLTLLNLQVDLSQVSFQLIELFQLIKESFVAQVSHLPDNGSCFGLKCRHLLPSVNLHVFSRILHWLTFKRLDFLTLL